MKNFLIKIFNIIRKTSIAIFKTLLCLFSTSVIGIGAGVVLTADKFDWQIILYLILFIAVIIGFWVVSFVKIRKLRILYLIVFIMFILSSVFLPSVRYQYDEDFLIDTGKYNGVKSLKPWQSDYCIEDGDCFEGQEVHTQYGLIKINKENCQKYNWKWDDKRKYCKVEYK